jgi:5-methylcytosine-specific restriction enzyme B
VQTNTSLVSLLGDEGPVTDRNVQWQINDDAFERIEAYLGIIDPQIVPSKTVSEREATSGAFTIKQLISGTIEVWKNGLQVRPAKHPLLELAKDLDIQTAYENGAPLNTRDLGRRVLAALEAVKA